MQLYNGVQMLYLTGGTAWLNAPFFGTGTPPSNVSAYSHVCRDLEDLNYRTSLRRTLFKLALRQWGLLCDHCPEHVARMRNMIPRSCYLNAMLSKRDKEALGLDEENPRHLIACTRIDIIMSCDGRAVRVHLDPNALGSVQSTIEVGLWDGAVFKVHLGDRVLLEKFRKP